MTTEDKAKMNLELLKMAVEVAMKSGAYYKEKEIERLYNLFYNSVYEISILEPIKN